MHSERSQQAYEEMLNEGCDMIRTIPRVLWRDIYFINVYLYVHMVVHVHISVIVNSNSSDRALHAVPKTLRYPWY